jgi:hypothetical protein
VAVQELPLVRPRVGAQGPSFMPWPVCLHLSVWPLWQVCWAVDCTRSDVAVHLVLVLLWFKLFRLLLLLLHMRLLCCCRWWKWRPRVWVRGQRPFFGRRHCQHPVPADHRRASLHHFPP